MSEIRKLIELVVLLWSMETTSICKVSILHWYPSILHPCLVSRSLLVAIAAIFRLLVPNLVHCPDGKARWNSGRRNIEIDAVGLDSATQFPLFVEEIKWSDWIFNHLKEFKEILTLATIHEFIEPLIAITRSSTMTSRTSGIKVNFRPTTVYCYSIATQEVFS